MEQIERVFDPERSPHVVIDAVNYWARVNRNAIAVICGDERLTYGELADRYLRYAGLLVERGVEPGDFVAIGVERRLDVVPLLLAVWAAGAAYVPVDPSYPLERRQHILQDSNAQFLISEEDEAGTSATLIPYAHFVEATNADEGTLPIWQPNDTAYVIYTSGSTGQPKGVVVTCNNLNNFLLGMALEPGLNDEDCLLAVTTISFDIHILELFLPLLRGAKVVVASLDQARHQDQLRALIDFHGVTIMQATPATWRLLLADEWLPQQKFTVLVGGEALPQDLLPRMHAVATAVWNMYGPTETTVWSTCCKLDEAGESISIGRPIRNTQIYVVNEHDQLVEFGEEGELLIGGQGVTAGYWRQSTLTADKFVLLSHLSDQTLYRTGDVVRHGEGGQLFYLSRVDNQIKIRGFRIEPGEVESLISTFEGILHVAVVACEIDAGDVRLVACVRWSGSDFTALREYCSAKLPAHMLPQYYCAFDAFPLTDNNKLDRKQLTKLAYQKCIDEPEEAVTINGAPRDDHDLSVIAVWEQALNRKGIGIDDDFFVLGGHSLLALSVIQGMSRAIGVSLTASSLFEHKTIRALLASSEEEARAASVVPLNTVTTNNAPVFCLCGVAIYSALARQFYEHSVYGVFAEQEIALIDAAQNDDSVVISLPQLVAAYTDAILRQGVFDEVILIGLSFGGILSVEVARALRAKGVEVKKIVLLDSYLDHSTHRNLGKTCCDVAVKVKDEGVLKSVSGLLKRIFKKVHNSHEYDVMTAPAAIDEAIRAQVYDQLARRSHSDVEAIEGGFLLIKATQTNFGLGMVAQEDYGWQRVLGGQLIIASVMADHIGLMSGDAVTSAYRHIHQYLKG